MSEILEQAVLALTKKMGEASFGGSAKFDIDGEGSIMIDAAGVRAGDEEADERQRGARVRKLLVRDAADRCVEERVGRRQA